MCTSIVVVFAKGYNAMRTASVDLYRYVEVPFRHLLCLVDPPIDVGGR